MNETTNYKLKKPEAHEYYNIEDFNFNADAIDAAMKGLQDSKADLSKDGKLKSEQLPDNVPTNDDRGKPDGLATLDGKGKVPEAQLPEGAFAAAKHASQHGKNGADPITPESIGAAAVSVEVTLLASGWTQDLTDGSKSQTVAVPGSTAQNIKVADVKLTKSDVNADAKILEAWARVNYGDDSTAGQITFWAYGKTPEADIPVTVVIAP